MSLQVVDSTLSLMSRVKNKIEKLRLTPPRSLAYTWPAGGARWYQNHVSRFMIPWPKIPTRKENFWALSPWASAIATGLPDKVSGMQ